jgi:PIN domain nuclease of toxin-antitoxin system
MRRLIDTQVILWAAIAPDRLSDDSVAFLTNPANSLYFSAASIWEIVIKNALGRPDFRVNPGLLRRGLIDNDYMELPITATHALATETLPPVHKDPLDRILVAQAIVEGMTLVTADALLEKYPVEIRKI